MGSISTYERLIGIAAEPPPQHVPSDQRLPYLCRCGGDIRPGGHDPPACAVAAPALTRRRPAARQITSATPKPSLSGCFGARRDFNPYSGVAVLAEQGGEKLTSGGTRSPGRVRYAERRMPNLPPRPVGPLAPAEPEREQLRGQLQRVRSCHIMLRQSDGRPCYRVGPRISRRS